MWHLFIQGVRYRSLFVTTALPNLLKLEQKLVGIFLLQNVEKKNMVMYRLTILPKVAEFTTINEPFFVK